MLENKNETPEVGHKRVPLWIKIMWGLGLLWIAIYIYCGLRSNPMTW